VGILLLQTVDRHHRDITFARAVNTSYADTMVLATSSHAARRLAVIFSSVALFGTAFSPGAASPVREMPHFAHWIDGTAASEPEMQVQSIDADTFVIRQSVRTNFEAPFLYLLFGQDRVLLIDSGAGGLSIRPTIDRLIDQWQSKHGGRPLRLVVAHSHGHGDHHAGDDEFRDRPDTDIVGLLPEEVATFFHITNWPQDIAHFDLGGRILDIIPTPGHQPAHIMVYDARTRLLFSGDMLYPGRLYVPLDKFDEFHASADRLAAFAATHPIRALLGAHIEMTTTTGQDYPMEAATHPSEHPLPLPSSTITELQQAAAKAGTAPQIDRHPDFILYPVPPRPAS
jgi:glyoxylase-like metal-dependent hydrolase (beta-lactamase superfamily II)